MNCRPVRRRQVGQWPAVQRMQRGHGFADALAQAVALGRCQLRPHVDQAGGRAAASSAGSCRRPTRRWPPPAGVGSGSRPSTKASTRASTCAWAWSCGGYKLQHVLRAQRKHRHRAAVVALRRHAAQAVALRDGGHAAAAVRRCSRLALQVLAADVDAVPHRRDHQFVDAHMRRHLGDEADGAAQVLLPAACAPSPRRWAPPDASAGSAWPPRRGTARWRAGR